MTDMLHYKTEEDKLVFAIGVVVVVVVVLSLVLTCFGIPEMNGGLWRLQGYWEMWREIVSLSIKLLLIIFHMFIPLLHATHAKC